jgi:hypothetical protein
MLSVSQRSQVGRLSRLLIRNGVLVNGLIHKEHGKVSQEDSQEISSIVSYLNGMHGYEAIQPWFADKLKEDTRPGYALNLAPPNHRHSLLRVARYMSTEICFIPKCSL